MKYPGDNPLKKLIHTLLKMSKKDVERRFKNAKVNITPLQYWVLIIIEHGPLTVNEIARKLDFKPPSLTPVVDTLEEGGYLQRLGDPKDRRKIQLVIGKKGLDTLKKLPLEDKKDGLNKSFKQMSQAKQKQLLELLQELTDNFAKYE